MVQDVKDEKMSFGKFGKMDKMFPPRCVVKYTNKL